MFNFIRDLVSLPFHITGEVLSKVGDFIDGDPKDLTEKELRDVIREMKRRGEL